jgi:acetyltransferase-like isoleucine patch superfamily enzyme
MRRAVEAEGLLKAESQPHIRQRHRSGRLVTGDRVHFFPGVAVYLRQPDSRVTIGDRTSIGRRTEFHCDQAITLGADCAISWDVQFIDSDQHQIEGGPGAAEIHVGDHVWIGQRALILKGVKIGDGAVVAAGSIVTHDVPAHSLVAGVPARVIRDHLAWS